MDAPNIVNYNYKKVTRLVLIYNLTDNLKSKKLGKGPHKYEESMKNVKCVLQH